MSSAPTRRQILTLYKHLIREAEKFPNYNFRSYACRRIRDAFRDSQLLTDKKIINEHFELGTKSLDMIRRQIIVGDLYKTEKLVIENISTNE